MLRTHSVLKKCHFIRIVQRHVMACLCGLFVVSLLAIVSSIARAELPGDYGSERQRIASAKAWSREPALWLPDGRLLIWVGKPDNPEARLFNPTTGQQDALVLYNRLRNINPPGLYFRVFNYLSPDGTFLLSPLRSFGTMTLADFYHILSLDGYQSLFHRVDRHIYWRGPMAWEWNAQHHGFVTYSDFNNKREVVKAVAHFDLAHPQEPRMVEMSEAALPLWRQDTRRAFRIELLAVTPTGEGIFAPYPNSAGVEEFPEWKKQHQVPVSLVDIDQGTRTPKDYLITIPREATVETFVFSPDASQIAWQLRFLKPHALPGHTGLYRTDEIWLSNLDGSNLHRLAYQAAFTNVTAFPDGLIDLAWKDTRTLSFIFNQALYTMPVR